MLFQKKIEAFYRSQLFSRCDDTGNLFYFSAADFPGMIQEAYPFLSDDGHRLQGYFYHYGKPLANRIVIFDHGMGGGHRSYMKEIERLARAGYRVFAYDHTGCMESEGEGTGGFSRSLRDLDAALSSLKKDPVYAGCAISVVGHSWGAFACLNIAAYHNDIEHVVALSGFGQVSDMVKQFFSGLLSPYAKGIYALEERTNPDYVKAWAGDSLKKSDAHVLIIHSADDKTAKASIHFEGMKKALTDRKNTVFLLVDGKNHNPNYTEDAVGYLNDFLKALKKKVKKKELETPAQKAAFVANYDWDRMTAQDETVWKAILDTLAQGSNASRSPNEEKR